MDFLAFGIGAFFGVIVYTILIYIMVKRIKKQRSKGVINNGSNFKAKDNKFNK